MRDTGITPQTVYVDRGYRRKKKDRLTLRTLLPDMKRQMIEGERKLASRRQAIEPIIGHLKSDHRLDRCYLKGQTGDAMHAVLCAVGYNIKWLMRRILQKGIKPDSRQTPSTNTRGSSENELFKGDSSLDDAAPVLIAIKFYESQPSRIF